MYHTLYDLRMTPPFDGLFQLLGILFTLGATLVWFAARDPARGGKPPLINSMILAFAVLWTSVVIGVPYATYALHLRALQTGHYRVATGTVQDFSTRSDGKGERFTVAGHSFKYSQPEEMARFHMTQGAGGPIRSGLAVRITYVNDDDIVLLEERTH